MNFLLRSGCKNSMNHAGEGLNHEAKHRCRYSVQYDNRVYTCKVSCELPTCSGNVVSCRMRCHLFMFFLTSGLL